MGDLMLIVPVLVFIVLIWFTYLIVNYVATIIKTKKKDKTMVCGLNLQGKVFYAILTIVYVAVFIGMIYLIISGYLKNGIDDVYLPLNILTIVSIVYGFALTLQRNEKTEFLNIIQSKRQYMEPLTSIQKVTT